MSALAEAPATALTVRLRCPAHPDAALHPGVAGARDQFWGIGERFGYGVCAACGAFVLDDAPAPAEIGRYYAGYYTERLLGLLRRQAAAGRRVGWAGRLRARGYLMRLADLGIPLSPKTQLLDVGCGLGAFPRYVRDFSGIQTRGVDFSPEVKAFAAEVHGVQVDTGELAAQRYPEGSFDLVTAWHYLEHVYDPLAELKEMARVLKPGGTLMIETPTPDVLAKLFGKRWLYLMPPTHLYHYRPDTLTALMQAAGLEVTAVRRPWFPGELAGSIMLACGVSAFVPQVFGPGRPFGHKLLTAALLGQMVWDVPVTVSLALLGRSGLLRVFAKKPT